MKPRRRLALKRETLSDLASDDLRSVIGGTHIATDCGCLTHGYSCDICGVPTLPLNVCIGQVTEITRECAAISGGLICEVTRSICAS